MSQSDACSPRYKGAQNRFPPINTSPWALRRAARLRNGCHPLIFFNLLLREQESPKRLLNTCIRAPTCKSPAAREPKQPRERRSLRNDNSFRDEEWIICCLKHGQLHFCSCKKCLGTSADAALPKAGPPSYFVINNHYKIMTGNTMYYSHEIFITLSLYSFLVSKSCPWREIALQELEDFAAPTHGVP